jgi:serine O-acetyltransferase
MTLHTAQDFELLRAEALAAAENEPFLKDLLSRLILTQKDFQHALITVLGSQCVFLHEGVDLSGAISSAIANEPDIANDAWTDLIAVYERDPATKSHLSPLLFYKGYQALQLYRVAHHLWHKGEKLLASYIQSRVSMIFGVDIHPASVIGSGIMFDHATGLVVGETARIGDNVSILHGVTLGGTGKETGKRHPTIGSGVLIGAGAAILGNIEVGDGAVIGAGSVVLKSVPPHCVAAGVPAEIKGYVRAGTPSDEMDQIFTNWECLL